MVNSAQNQLGEWDVHSIRANDVISATLTRWTLTPYVRRHCGSGHLQIFSVQRFQSLWGFGDGLREHQLSKVPTRISDRQASKRPLSRIRQTSRTERKRRCIPTITNWFIGKLEPTYFEKVPLENKQFALSLCLERKMQLWPSSAFALYPQSIALWGPVSLCQSLQLSH